MTAGLIAPFDELVAEGHNVFNAGADVVALSGYFTQRIELLRNPIKAIPAGKSSPHA
jgi:hypothetical protein